MRVKKHSVYLPHYSSFPLIIPTGNKCKEEGKKTGIFLCRLKSIAGSGMRHGALLPSGRISPSYLLPHFSRQCFWRSRMQRQKQGRWCGRQLEGCRLCAVSGLRSMRSVAIRRPLNNAGSCGGDGTWNGPSTCSYGG